MLAQYVNDVVLTSVQRRFNVMDVVWMSKRCRVLTGREIKMLSIFKGRECLRRCLILVISNITIEKNIFCCQNTAVKTRF